MREIKFRAWDNKKECFTDYQIMDDFILFFEKHNGCWLSNKENRFELMQYTGAKDKNGKEIYEGDIVVLNNIENDNMCIVRYEHSSYRLEGWSLREDLSNVEDRFLEVVGNIYENKNLLEENN